MAADDRAARLAVLIDADNASPALAGSVLAEVATYGTAHVKRAYGDWTSNGLRSWKPLLLTLSIQPIQQFAYTSGKNATDAAMVIDAMDLLYSGRFDGFCIVSSDSDFTRLAARIRESGLTVYGFGERKTPSPFVAACDKFTYVENLDRPAELDQPAALDSVGQLDPAGQLDHSARLDHSAVVDHPAQPAEPGPPSSQPAAKVPLSSDSRLVRQLRAAVEAASDDDGWAALARVGHVLTNTSPDFDPRSWGYRKLSDLITATGLFETDRRRGSGAAVIYIRDRRRRPDTTAELS